MEHRNFLQSLSNETDNFQVPKDPQKIVKGKKALPRCNDMWILDKIKREAPSFHYNQLFTSRSNSLKSVFHRTAESQTQYDNLDCREVIYVLS